VARELSATLLGDLASDRYPGGCVSLDADHVTSLPWTCFDLWK
jgi:hypothetical protein